ncbi:MAG TPA: nickel pincer cofactor biosynthesis protein LarB [Thermodesulfovibrionales bacterium]|nr:nickel pincer cofactor biosynthesis protein LarB [Thermodesulfovibrionales bacterium]
MHNREIAGVLAAVRSGKLSVENAMERLRHLPYEDLSFARVDHHRHLRQGIPEVIYAKGKTVEAIKAIAHSMHRKSGKLLITRATQEICEALGMKEAVFHPASGIISVGRNTGKKKGSVLVVSAGTSDIPVAEEASVTASFLGSRTDTEYDVGVAGIHRLLEKKDKLTSSRVVVVVAGMEGALPSVIGGLTDRPIVAVPTSTGYGTSLGGLTALFAMLNSCVPGIAVMNVDNGFGAGCLAHRINSL